MNKESDFKTDFLAARSNTDAGSSPSCGTLLLLWWWWWFLLLFSLPESASSADSETVSVQPPCAIASINIYAHVKNPKHWQPYHCLDTQKCCTHREVWVMLFLQVPVKVICISCKGQRSKKYLLKKNLKN